jgi:hypothetical protein
MPCFASPNKLNRFLTLPTRDRTLFSPALSFDCRVPGLSAAAAAAAAVALGPPSSSVWWCCVSSWCSAAPRDASMLPFVADAPAEALRLWSDAMRDVRLRNVSERRCFSARDDDGWRLWPRPGPGPPAALLRGLEMRRGFGVMVCGGVGPVAGATQELVSPDSEGEARVESSGAKVSSKPGRVC